MVEVSARRLFAAEAIGTFVLVFAGPGSAVLATGGFFGDGSIGVVGVSLSFGLALLVMAYAIGNISGCHINPAVTLGLILARELEARKAGGYVAGQLLGGVLAGFLIWVVAAGASGGFTPRMPPTSRSTAGVRCHRVRSGSGRWWSPRSP